jgi:hypothetical protein
MIQIRRMARRALVAAFVAALAVSASGQGRGQGPQTGGKPSVERRRGDNPRIPFHAAQAIPTPSGDTRIDALLSDYKWAATAITYSFYSDSVFAGTYYGSEDVSEVSEPVKANVRDIMAWYGTFLNVTFVEVTETSNTIGVIRVMRSSGPAYAYAYYPANSTMFGLSGDVHLNPGYDRLGDTNGFQQPAGEHGYVSLIHEIGHALGLKHPHDDSPNLPAGEDTHSFTVMSYQFPGESPGTPMGYDLLALQYRYGARPYRTANDTYAFQRPNIDQYRLGTQLYITPSLATKQSIWDNGGYNVLDLSGVTATSGYRLDLNPLGWLSTNANYHPTYLGAGTVLGPGVAIGKVVNSAGDDTIHASSSANVFAGYSVSRVTGRDVIHAADAMDTIDLSGYVSGDVRESASGSDLVLDLGANGSVTVKNYYGTGSQPAIVYGTEMPRVSIGDATVSEGSGGTISASFAVSLSAPAPGARVVSYATTDVTALAGNDYVAASGAITFAAGETQKVLTVLVNGDTTEESDETFSVTLAVADGVEILDGEGVGTILNDDLPANQPPVAHAQSITTAEDAAIAVTLSGSDADGHALTYRIVSGPAHGALSGTAPGLIYTPAANDNGVDSFTFAVNDGRVESSAATVSITITPGNDAPVALNGAASVPAGGFTSGTLVATDVDGNPLTYSLVSNGTKGVATITNASTGSYTYSANSGTSGTDTFTFRVSDGTVTSNTATVTVTITAPPPPAAPANLSATVQYSGSGKNKVLQGVQLTWSDASSNENQFRIQRCQVTGKGRTQTCTYPATSTIVPSNSTGYFEPASSLTRPATYRYRVRSENAVGESVWVEVQVSVS